MRPKLTISPNGTKKWVLDGKLHREDGPAVEKADGEKSWFLRGKLHREDGPAMEFPDGDYEWWLNDRRHREDGPAVSYLADLADQEWWLYGIKYTFDEFAEKMNWSTEQIIEWKLTHEE